MKMLICISAMLLSSSVWAAFMKNVPQTLTQPNGTVVNAFASGDEYYNWIHDANNYTILKNAKTGYYVYAAKSSGKLIATNYVVGQINPSSAGLTPNLLDDASVISTTVKAKQASRNAQKNNHRSVKGANLSVRPAVGDYNNIVIYIEFSDQNGSSLTRTACESIFNGTGVVSVKDFYTEVSAGQLNVNSTFYPASGSTYPVYYKDSHPRSYYLKDTPDGYGTGETAGREHLLLKNAINAVASQVPANLVIDGNNDGFVDNVTFVINGQPAGWGDLLWPHRWALFAETAYINSKQVYDYNTCFSESIGAGVISHEMFHSFSAPDLYSYSNWTTATAVGDWDLMSSGDWTTPRHMTVYLKSRYGTWTTIPEITTTGTYTLQSVATSPFSAFKIKLPNTTEEYVVVEYRKKAGRYETALSGDDGMLVYRVNESGSNGGGPNNEVYVYRPNGSNSETGDIFNATLNNAFGRTGFNDATNPSDILSNNQLGGLLANAGISNVVVNGNSLTFKFTVNTAPACADPAWNAATAYNGGAKVSYNNIVYTANWWTQGAQPDLNTGSGKPWTQTGTCGAANRAPVVTFTAPAKNANINVGTNVILKADAVDPDGVISKVEFLNSSDVVIFSDNTAPFEYTLTGLAKGSYVYKVKAYDNQNLASDFAFTNFAIVGNALPVITITAPVAVNGINPTYVVGGSLTISANVSDPDGTVAKVEFTPGSNTAGLVTKTAAPYTVTFTNLPAPSPDGSYWFTIKAYDNEGGTTTQTLVVYRNKLPTIGITSPVTNTTFAAGTTTVPVSLSVNDPDFISGKIEYFNGAAKLGETIYNSTLPGPAINYNLTNLVAGTYALTAKITDDKGQTGTSTVVNFTITAGQNQLPVVTITSPVAVSGINPTYVVGGSVTVSANVSDQDGTITKVEFTQGTPGTGLVTKTSAPYSVTFSNLPEPSVDGSYAFNVKAYDNSGGVTNKLVIVYKNKKPTIGITSPAQNATISNTTPVTITSQVIDADFISGKVEYFNGAVKLGETIYTSPFAASTITFNAGILAAGTYALTAKITDDKGQTGVSSVVNFTVTGGATCTDPAWNAATVYNGGEIVSRLGKRYQAKWWTQNAAPETNSNPANGGAWALLGNCGARVAEVLAVNSASVYPNPFVSDATFVLELAGDDKISVDVFNIYGVKVATVFSGAVEAGSHSFKLSSQNLSAGIYIVHVSGTTINEKVTVVKN